MRNVNRSDRAYQHMPGSRDNQQEPNSQFNIQSEGGHHRAGQSHIVQQVIYNQGSVVINNGAGGQQSAQHQAPHYQNIPNQTIAARSQQLNTAHAPGHTKTKSTSFVVGQGGLILAPTQQIKKTTVQPQTQEQKFNYSRQSVTSGQNIQIGPQFAYPNSAGVSQQHQRFGQDSQVLNRLGENSFQKVDATPQVNIQPSVAPGHKKSQSMINSKIANLLVKGGKQTGHQRANANLTIATKSGDQEINRSIERLIISHQLAKSTHEVDDDHKNNRNVDDKKLSQSFLVQSQHNRAITQGQEGSYSRQLDFSARNSVDGSKKTQQINSSRPQSKSNNGNPQQTKLKARTDKISSNGKVIASSATVKKPASQIKQPPTQNSIITGPQPQLISSQHHRVKSDSHQSKKTKELIGQLGASAIQQQKGKVGKILKNNFVDSATNQSTGASIIHGNVSGQQSQAPSSQLTLQQKNIIRTFQQPPTSTVQIQSVSPGHGAANKKKQAVCFNNPVLSAARKKIVKDVKRQSTKEKYQELQGLYNELLEKHVHLLSNTQSNNTGQTSQNSSFNLKQNQQIAVPQSVLRPQVGKSKESYGKANPNNNLRSMISKETSNERNSSYDIQAEGHLSFQQINVPVSKDLSVHPGSGTSSNDHGIIFSQSFGQLSQPNRSNLRSLNSEEYRVQQSTTKIDPQGKKKVLQQQIVVNPQMQQTTERSENVVKKDQKIIKAANQMTTGPTAPSHRRSASDGTDINLVRFNLNAIEILKSGKNTESQLASEVQNQPKLPNQTEDISNSNKSNHSRLNTGGTAKQIVQPNDRKVRQNSSGRRVDAESGQSLNQAQNFQKTETTQNSGKQQKGINPKFKVTESDEAEKANNHPTTMTKKIPFHHPRLSGSWAQNNNAMVIQENNPSVGSEPHSKTPSENDNSAAHQSHEVVMSAKDGRPVVKFHQREDVNSMAFSYSRRKKQCQKLINNSNMSMQTQKQEGNQQYLDSQKGQKPGHKRVKSDAIDNHKIKMIADISGIIHPTSQTQPPSSGQRSLKQLQKRLGKVNQPQELTQQQLYGETPSLPKGEPEKIVNVSIDDIEDEEESVEEQIVLQNEWVRVKASDMKDQNWQQGLINQYKSGRESSSQDITQKVTKRSDGGQDSSARLDKYKQILKNAKHNFHSKSEVPTKQQLMMKPTIQKKEDVIKQGEVREVYKRQLTKPQQVAKPDILVSKEIFVAPQNSLNTSQRITVDERILTDEDIDSTLSPEKKIQQKLYKHIQKAYNETGTCPPTSVDFYRVGKILGKGAFGKVNLAMHQLTQETVAIKSINKTHFSEASQSKKVMQEVMILRQTRHKNIVRLYEYFETEKHILFVIELSSGGDLLNYVRKRRQLKEDVAKSVFKQLIEGLRYCHSKSILHRDIKLDNILLSVDGEIKICDFGVSKFVRKGEKMSEQCGTPAYIAPEILLDKGYEGFMADIWSAGVVLYAMLYGTVPFKANNMSELQKMIIKGKYQLQEGISKEARDLLGKLMEKEISKRITIPNILAHPWMKDAKPKIQLFTSAEQNYMQSIHNGVQGANQVSDPFMDQMLDTCQNSMLKNAETKSIILAPFNSTKSNLKQIEEHYSIPEEIKEMIQSKSCMKFAYRVREIDRQYEVNNNAELDNGVYHEFNKDEKDQSALEKEDSLLSEFTDSQRAHGGKQTELQRLEKMINKEQKLRVTSSQGNIEEYHDEVREHTTNKQHNKSTDLAFAVGEERLVIDQELVQKVSEFGYPIHSLQKNLKNSELNNATTSYFLLEKRKRLQEVEVVESSTPT